MNPLGQRLVFCLRHKDEMARLYWNPSEEDKQCHLRELGEDTAAMEEMVKAVGDAATQEASRFLKEWGALLFARLAQIGQVKRVTTKGAGRHWRSHYRVWGRGGGRFEVWLYLRRDLGEAAGLVWCHNRDAEEQALCSVNDPLWRSAEGRTWGGTVLFARVGLLPADDSAADHDRDPLIARTAAPLLAWTEREVEALAALSPRKKKA